MPDEGKTPLSEFYNFLRDFNNIYAQIGKLAIAAPMVDLVLHLGPPWPSRAAVSFSLVAVQILIVMISFSVWRKGKTRSHAIHNWLVGSSVAFVCLFLVVYVPLFSAFVVPDPTYWSAKVIGFTYTEPIRKFVEIESSKGEVWNSERLIKYFVDGTSGVDAIWTPASVTIARVSLLSTWILAGIMYAIAVSAFIAVQYRRFDRMQK